MERRSTKLVEQTPSDNAAQALRLIEEAKALLDRAMTDLNAQDSAAQDCAGELNQDDFYSYEEFVEYRRERELKRLLDG